MSERSFVSDPSSCPPNRFYTGIVRTPGGTHGRILRRQGGAEPWIYHVSPEEGDVRRALDSDVMELEELSPFVNATLRHTLAENDALNDRLTQQEASSCVHRDVSEMSEKRVREIARDEIFSLDTRLADLESERDEAIKAAWRSERRREEAFRRAAEAEDLADNLGRILDDITEAVPGALSIGEEGWESLPALIRGGLPDDDDPVLYSVRKSTLDEIRVSKSKGNWSAAGATWGNSPTAEALREAARRSLREVARNEALARAIEAEEAGNDEL